MVPGRQRLGVAEGFAVKVGDKVVGVAGVEVQVGRISAQRIKVNNMDGRFLDIFIPLLIWSFRKCRL
jgi:hypothetical protein